MTDEPSKPLLQSYVYNGDHCWYVSTVERTFDTAVGQTRGLETLVWEYDDKERVRGEMVGHMGGLNDHIAICRCFIAEGVMLDDNGEQHERFRRP